MQDDRQLPAQEVNKSIQEIALSRGHDTGSRQLKILSTVEIENATNNYDPNLVVGNLQSTVFKGLIDDQVVAVKVSRDFQLNHLLIGVYLTEAAISMVMNHENLVKIYGSCLETYIPMMVYQYMPNGSLFKHLYSDKNRIRWSDRAVQSFITLLDQSFRAKLSNFGYSVTLTPGETTQNGPVIGSPGCTDPEYVETAQVTEKFDVYSFRVLLLELLTGKHPITMARHGTDLVDVFGSTAEKNGMMEMIDREVLEQ
ncbi:wall-associated receptor kinase-like 22 [Silene latifolia]|uniref:wall-associated receptor kinase-like 22 n=1 Tax=Silene latifolia TaxID=37657 RepID=UPI003D77319D